MKKIKELYYETAKNFYWFIKEFGWTLVASVGMTLWLFATFYAISAKHDRERYHVQCYSGINKIYEADDIKVTWTGINNIEVVEGISEKKIYGDCVLILNEER
jgi:hypothetical protein